MADELIINGVASPSINGSMGNAELILNGVVQVGVTALELNLTNTADLTAWLTKYTGSYTRASSMWVKDYLGVYRESGNNVAPFYGGRLVGAEWFDTDGSGDLITSKIGLASWPSTTNVIGSTVYRDFTHADWNVTDCSITAGAVVLIDGTSVSDKNTLTASGANGTMILDPYTSASGVHSGGVFIKRKTGTGAIEVTVDGGSTWVAVTTQVAGDSGWHLCQTTLPTVTDPEFGVRLVTSGDAVYLDWAQMDDGYKRVSVHPIVGGATLAAQNCIVADATNAASLIQDKQGYVIAHAQLLPDDFSLTHSSLVRRESGEFQLLAFSESSGLYSSDGTNAQVFWNALVGYSKASAYWWGSSKKITSNGVSESTDSYDGSWGTGYIKIITPFNGIISKVIFGAGIETTQADMELETTS